MSQFNTPFSNILKLRKQQERLAQNKEAPPSPPPFSLYTPVTQCQATQGVEDAVKPNPERSREPKRAYAKRWRVRQFVLVNPQCIDGIARYTTSTHRNSRLSRRWRDDPMVSVFSCMTARLLTLAIADSSTSHSTTSHTFAGLQGTTARYTNKLVTFEQGEFSLSKQNYR